MKFTEEYLFYIYIQKFYCLMKINNLRCLIPKFYYYNCGLSFMDYIIKIQQNYYVY